MVKEYADKCQFKEAINLSTKITNIDSIVSQAAFETPYIPLQNYETFQEYFERIRVSL